MSTMSTHLSHEGFEKLWSFCQSYDMCLLPSEILVYQLHVVKFQLNFVLASDSYFCCSGVI